MRPGRPSLVTLIVSAGILCMNGDAPVAQSANAHSKAIDFSVKARRYEHVR